MKIRTLQSKDIKASSRIVGKNYSKDFERKSFREMEASFKNYAIKPHYIVVEEKGEIIGFAGYTQSWMDYDIYTIFWVNVAPGYQRKGIGSELVKKVIDLIKKKKAKMILLVTDKPKFYQRRFNFKSITYFQCDGYTLMSLRLKR